MFESATVKGYNGEVIGWVMFERGEGYSYCCSKDDYEDWGYPEYDRAENELLRHYYS